MKKYSYCAVAYLINDPYKKIICETSRKLATLFGSWFVLNEQVFPPHLTTWIAYVPENNVNSIKERLIEVNSSIKSFTFKTKNIEIQNNGYISLEIEINDQLRELHMNLLENLNIFREGYIPEKYIENWNNLSEEHQKSIELFGTRAAGTFFNPHITLGVIKKEFINSCQQSIPYELENIELALDNLSFFRQADEGRSVEFLYNMKLF